MKILISNDDGVLAEGITVLSSALSKIAHVNVVAPDRNRSGASNSLTLDRPIRVKNFREGYMQNFEYIGDQLFISIDNRKVYLNNSFKRDECSWLEHNFKTCLKEKSR